MNPLLMMMMGGGMGGFGGGFSPYGGMMGRMGGFSPYGGMGGFGRGFTPYGGMGRGGWGGMFGNMMQQPQRPPMQQAPTPQAPPSDMALPNEMVTSPRRWKPDLSNMDQHTGHTGGNMVTSPARMEMPTMHAGGSPGFYGRYPSGPGLPLGQGMMLPPM